MDSGHNYFMLPCADGANRAGVEMTMLKRGLYREMRVISKVLLPECLFKNRLEVGKLG